MPPKRNKKAKDYIELEGKIEIAISDLKNKKISSACQAAQIYGIAPSTLYNRLNGAKPRAARNSEKRKLTQTEEDMLI